MISFLYDLKGQFTLLNGLLVLLISAYFFNRYKKRKVAIVLVSISILIFLLCSTDYLPCYLAAKLEKKYSPINLPIAKNENEKVLIHVLGSGYALDKRLPPTAQLGLVALGRLAEGIRIHRAINNSVIICSGYSSLGLETQAQVAKKAAIILGVAADQIETLNNPSTTQEEAKELGRLYEKSLKLIIVTDAIHMPRAMDLFRAEGFNPIAAPTNFKINEGPSQEGMKWWPSLGNIGLMNYVIHESLGNLKASMFK